LQAVLNEYNFDCPDAFDIDCIVYTLRRLKEGKSVEIPVYNFATHRAEKKRVQYAFHFCFVIYCLRMPYLLQKFLSVEFYLRRILSVQCYVSTFCFY